MDKKYCTNCGTENVSNAKFCISCGSGFETKPVEETVVETPTVTEQPVEVASTSTVEETPVVTTDMPTQVVTPEPPKKKKKKGGLIALIVILLIAGLIVGGIFLFKKLTYFEDPFEETGDVVPVNYAEAVKLDDVSATALEQIEEDYKAGLLTDDQYILQLAYILYEPTKLDPKYSSLEYEAIDVNYLMGKLEPIVKKLSKDTIYYLVQVNSYINAQWEVGDGTSQNESLNSSVYNYKVEKLAYDPRADMNILSEVKLSSDGNFLLFYTKKGSNAITDEYANEIIGMLENTVKEYENTYNLKYQYDSKKPNFDFANSSRSHAEELLKYNNIDTKYLDTAMPIYMINLSETDILGYYNPIPSLLFEALGDIAVFTPVQADPGTNIQITTLFSTYAFPYFVANAGTKDVDNMKIIISHELFHHYQAYLCGDGEYGSCSSDKFITEMTAQLGAVNVSGVNDTGTFLNKWAKRYVEDCSTSLENVYDSAGYPAYPFAYNYERIVNNGSKKLFKSMRKDNSTVYLSNHSNGKYKKVMTTTAEKFLTLDYDQKLLIATNLDDDKPIYPRDNWSKKEKNNTVGTLYFEPKVFTTNHSSMQYTYINPNAYEDLSNNINELKITSNSKDLVLLFFVKQDNRYQMIHSQDLDKPFIIDINEWKDYDELAISIVDYSVKGTSKYTASIIKNGDSKPTLSPEKVKDKLTIKKSKIVCSQVEDIEYIKTTYQVMVEFGHNDDIKDMYVKGTVEMEDNYAFKIAKGVTTGAVFLLKQKYKDEFGKITLRTYDEGNKYIILGRVKKDFDTAARNSFGTNDLTREGIFKAIEDKGFTCEYR